MTVAKIERDPEENLNNAVVLFAQQSPQMTDVAVVDGIKELAKINKDVTNSKVATANNAVSLVPVDTQKPTPEEKAGPKKDEDADENKAQQAIQGGGNDAKKEAGNKPVDTTKSWAAQMMELMNEMRETVVDAINKPITDAFWSKMDSLIHKHQELKKSEPQATQDLTQTQDQTKTQTQTQIQTQGQTLNQNNSQNQTNSQGNTGAGNTTSGQHSPTELKAAYETLGLKGKEDADPADIRKAYRKEALKWHPDKNSDPEAPAKFRAANEAFETIQKSTGYQEKEAANKAQQDNTPTGLSPQSNTQSTSSSAQLSGMTDQTPGKKEEPSPQIEADRQNRLGA